MLSMNLKRSLEIINRIDRIEPERFGVRESFWESLGAIFARHPEIEAAVLFSSRARGTHRYGSDIDVCLLGPEVTWDTRVRVLSEYWDDMWPWRLDLKHWETATSPRFREEIRRDAQLIYDREGSTALPVALR